MKKSFHWLECRGLGIDRGGGEGEEMFLKGAVGMARRMKNLDKMVKRILNMFFAYIHKLRPLPFVNILQ